jgi:hypothetical protein
MLGQVHCRTHQQQCNAFERNTQCPRSGRIRVLAALDVAYPAEWYPLDRDFQTDRGFALCLKQC